MIRMREVSAVATSMVETTSITALIKRAAANLSSATTATEILDARDLARSAYDGAKSAARFAKAKKAHDDVISAVYRAQVDALEIESMAKRRLADEYDAAQERGEAAKVGQPSIVPVGNDKPATAADIGLTRKDIHEARQIRDAEAADPGIVRRVLDEKLAENQEPTKSALREAVIEAAKRGDRPAPAPTQKNPVFRSPTEAGAAWAHLYGTSRALVEWATDENISLALRGCGECADDQSANLEAVLRCSNIIKGILDSLSSASAPDGAVDATNDMEFSVPRAKRRSPKVIYPTMEMVAGTGLDAGTYVAKLNSSSPNGQDGKTGGAA